MLLPSDIARLVLGYLQEEGLCDTSRAFIHESPNLKEYAEHSSEDGTVPACVFSIFGKGLTTILNDYVAVKTKESNHQVPPMMSSLWKKLDFTLNQIRSLQNSPSLAACQRVRSRSGLANLSRQRALANSPSGVVCTTMSETISIVSPAQTSHCLLTHSTPMSYSSQLRPTPSSAPPLQSQDASKFINTPKDSLVLVTEHRGNPAPMSPGRRKWKRAGALGGSAGSSRPVPVGGISLEEQTEEIVDENFPQLVIQNAREKILGDRALQEKLAENINKILSCEPPPQSKAATNMVEPDQSIDEILGLQGEIHMSDDAIHDILEQTESDPAFQALYDLFECYKSRAADGETADADMSSSPEEGDSPGTVQSVSKPSLSVDSDPTQKDASDPAPTKTKSVPERKTRKSAPLIKKTIIPPGNRNSRIENSSSKLLSVVPSTQEPQGTASTKGTEKSPYFESSTPMEVEEPRTTASPSPTSVSTTIGASVSAPVASNNVTSLPPTTTASTPNLNSIQGNKESQESSAQPVSAPKSNQKDNSLTMQPVPSLSSLSQELPTTGRDSQTSVKPVSSETSKSSASNSVTSNSTATTALTSPVSVSSATTPSSVSPSSLPASSTDSTPTSKTPADPNNIMSLKIIISDNQEEESAADTALNQAISSISGDKIPTIYLSSPAKSSAVPGTPRSSADETAQAVSCLQRSESVMASPLTGTSQPQQSYIIQLPFDGAATTAASYFLVTEPENRQKMVPAPVSKGQSIAPASFGVNTQTQGFSAGSALILPSPMKPLVLPLSVVGQKTLGNVQMMQNQLVALPSPTVMQQPDTVKSLPAGAAKPNATSSAEKNPAPSSAPCPGLSSSPSSGHRRILCFESSGETQTSKNNTTASSGQSLPPKSRTKPTILTSNKPKRRIETVRCSESTSSQQPNQKEPTRKGSRKQEHNVSNKDSRNIELVNSVPSDTGRKSSERKQNSEEEREKEPRSTRSQSSDSSQKSRKEKEPTEKSKTRESRTEKRTQEIVSVTANKENELKGRAQEQSATSSSAPVQPNTQKSSKPVSKTSALAKQAAEMLHDIQALNSPSTPKAADLSSQEESGSECSKTPVRGRKSRDVEGTPRHLIPPNSSDLPTCSPASEAGSESSINMAAHTLMILSRAALARTGTPLKNSLRQEGAGEQQQSPTSSKVTKKRKQSTPTSSPPAKREAKRTPSKKKDRKKLVECFPQDLDVDKFLSSLHYDE